MTERTADTPVQILEAARGCLLAEGYAKLSTRKVADAAGVPLSQIHYHFGGKQGLVLALLDRENSHLIGRQQRMYAIDAPLWKRYEQACDFLDDDIASGYVRVLQEMIAAGWSDTQVAQQILGLLQSWQTVLEDVAGSTRARLGPLTAEDAAALIGMSFLGGEALILLGDETWARRVRAALRSLVTLIRHIEEADRA
ncbi:TetR/AcrR family transcriptional regulator [Actinoplanes sp. LDG1-06]|uniref:TetR/AcrR family transcriptional regulator n=1 Tax=Paractinoplanes ovalisporus TaxID=2810368 RepID=A0ABS2AMC7_9ACTN|nr:TetR/AcrR family transcriptional regulator [Actinoplanes ovalisporus]MBM2620359.1 TetR/AcrR family transcriptional regulator [Actinoplanes ovalisporus]